MALDDLYDGPRLAWGDGYEIKPMRNRHMLDLLDIMDLSIRQIDGVRARYDGYLHATADTALQNETERLQRVSKALRDEALNPNR